MAFSFQSFSEHRPVFWISEIRRIELTRGLNIIWSEPGKPGGSKKQRGRGHAAGKTSFCRAIRYILGEDQYGSKFVEERIAGSKELNDASVWIGDTQWSIFRPLNKRHWQKQEFAVQGADFLEAINTLSDQRYAYSDFIEKLEEATLEDLQVKHYDTEGLDPISWLDFLMPLARDQESHLSSLHNWRDSSASTTPAKFTPATKAFLMRAMLGIASAKESKQLQSRAKYGQDVSKAEQTITTYRQVLQDQVAELEESLETTFELPAPNEITTEKDDLFLAAVRSVALKASNTAKKEVNKKLKALTIKETEKFINQSNGQIEKIEGRIEERQDLLQAQKRFLKALKSTDPPKNEKAPDLGDELFKNASQRGKFCKVPLGDAIEHCQHYWRFEIKKRLLEEPQTAIAEFASQKVRAAELAILELENELKPHLSEIAVLEKLVSKAQTDLKNQETQRDDLEEALEDIDEEFNSSIQAADTIADAILRQENAKKSIAEANSKIRVSEDILSDIRKDYTDQQAKLSELFNFVISHIVSDDLTGELKFSKIDINATLTREGELESAAYRALRCIAYDFTALTARLAGIGNHPGFLLHDSPRESDLEYSLYQQIFTFAAHLNEAAPNSFQYIVTTTEAPPKKLIESHVKLNLDGSTKQGRLYRQNL